MADAPIGGPSLPPSRRDHSSFVPRNRFSRDRARASNDKSSACCDIAPGRVYLDARCRPRVQKVAHARQQRTTPLSRWGSSRIVSSYGNIAEAIRQISHFNRSYSLPRSHPSAQRLGSPPDQARYFADATNRQCKPRERCTTPFEKLIPPPAPRNAGTCIWSFMRASNRALISWSCYDGISF